MGKEEKYEETPVSCPGTTRIYDWIFQSGMTGRIKIRALGIEIRYQEP